MDENKCESIFKSIVKKKETCWCAFGETKHSSYDSCSLSIIESENHIAERIKPDQSDSLMIRTFDVLYISDLHLDTHILSKYPNGATDEEIFEYIRQIGSDLLTGTSSLDFLRSKRLLMCIRNSADAPGLKTTKR